MPKMNKNKNEYFYAITNSFLAYNTLKYALVQKISNQHINIICAKMYASKVKQRKMTALLINKALCSLHNFGTFWTPYVR